MPQVELIGHEYFYHIRDVVKMFYKNVSETPTSVNSTPEDNILIRSILIPDQSTITTIWNDANGERKISTKVPKEIYKREIKRQLYEVLSEITGISLPWGSLTGIRPTLIASESGYDRDMLINYYSVSREKADLAVETALKEDEIKSKLKLENFHCYIGIPLCSSRCSYCSFLSGELAVYSKWIPQYIAALIKELDAFLPYINGNIGSIYIGGGTPSVLQADDIGKILDCINRNKRQEIPEFTFEAGRADSVTGEKLDIIKKGNVNRICLNPQTLNDKTLKLIGRNHSSGDFYEIYEMISKLEFECVNTDIIAGLPGEKLEDYINTLSKIVELKPDNITIHSLSRKKISKIGQETSPDIESKSLIYNLPDKYITSMINYSQNLLKENLYVPYYLYRQKDTVGGQENTGYAKDGKYCIYNVAMMGDYSNIIGFGAKSVSKKIESGNSGTKISRYYNIRDIILYIKNIDKIIDEKKEFFGFK